MLLMAVDIGNTNVVIGFIDDGRIALAHSLRTCAAPVLLPRRFLRYLLFFIILRPGLPSQERKKGMPPRPLHIPSKNSEDCPTLCPRKGAKRGPAPGAALFWFAGA